MAVIEAIPVLFMIVIVFNFSVGFFGAIHSGILNSIGAYNYAFETFRYRSNLMYFRPGVDNKNYKAALNRVHGVVKDGTEESADEEKGVWPATIREITFSSINTTLHATPDKSDIFQESDRKYAGRNSQTNIWSVISTFVPQTGKTIQTPRIWIKTVYGICVTADCNADGYNQGSRT